MISQNDLRKISRARLRDSEVLHGHERYDGAIYLCGYAIEMALKARVCKTLKWSEFPSTRAEFQPYQSFRTHNLDVLLTLSGLEAKIKGQHLADWSIIAAWDPEVRYNVVGTATQADARDMIAAAKKLMAVL